MSGDEIALVTGGFTVISGAIAAVWKRTSQKLDQCEETHEECEKNHAALEVRVARIDGFMDGAEAEAGGAEPLGYPPASPCVFPRKR